MAVRTDVGIWAKLVASVVDGATVARQVVAHEFWAALSSEEAVAKASQTWCASGTLAADAEAELDLTALPSEALGVATAARAFTNMRGLLVQNLSTNANAILQLGAAADDALAGIVVDADEHFNRVPAGGCFLWSDPLAGIEVVDGVADKLLLKNIGSVTAAYRIALVGERAAGVLPMPAMPAAEPEPRFLYGDNGPWDVGLCGNLTYAVSATRWRFAAAIAWYNFWAESGMGRGCNSFQTNNDVMTGLPTAVGIFQGTVNRLKAQQPNALVGFYLTLAQIANEDGQNHPAVSAWPRTRPLWDAEWDALGAGDWDNSDIDPGDTGLLGKNIDLANAAARELSAVKNAEIVAQAKAENPAINLVFSDNHAIITGDTSWTQQMDRAARFTSKINHLGVAFVPNVTTSSFTGATVGATPGDLTGYWDQAVAAGVAGIYTEGTGHAHLIRSSRFAAMCANIKNWISRPWSGGGRRMLMLHAAIGVDAPTDPMVYGLNRRLTVVNATVFSTTELEFETATPHFYADTSYPTVSFGGVHAAINGPERIISSVINSTKFRIITGSPHGISSFSLDGNSVVHFLKSGIDVDFGVLHMLRAAGDSTLCWWNPDGLFAEPLWKDDFSVFGEVVPGSLTVVDEAVVAGNLCIKEVKYQFAQGPSDQRWHHIRFDMEGRRRWRAAS